MSKELKEVANRPPNAAHESFVKWIKRETGKAVDIEAVTIALRLHPHFRTTEDYVKARAKQSEARQAEIAAQHQRAKDRLAERVAKAEAAAAALKARLDGTDVPEPVKKGTEKAKQIAKTKAPAAPAKPKVTKPKAPAAPKDEDPGSDNVTSIRRSRPRRGTQTPAEDDDDPF